MWSTWRSEAPGALVGVGIDAESSGRFGEAQRAWVDVFTPAERELPETRLTAAFCTKEALLKALGRPFDPLDAELSFSADGQLPELRLAPRLLREHGIGFAQVRVSFSPDGGAEVVVHAFGPRRRDE